MTAAEERFVAAARQRGLDLEVRHWRRARGPAEEVRAATGYAIGGTPPFGYPRPLTVVIDEDLLDHAVVCAAAGTPETAFSIDPDVLRETSDATVADIGEI